MSHDECILLPSAIVSEISEKLEAIGTLIILAMINLYVPSSIVPSSESLVKKFLGGWLCMTSCLENVAITNYLKTAFFAKM
jgi:hypothetical protein